MASDPLIFRFVMNRLRDIGKIALMLSFVSVALLGCGSSGSQDGRTLTTGTPTAAQLTGDDGVNRWNIAGDTTGTNPLVNLILESPINGAESIDEVQIIGGGVVASIAFSSNAPTGGAVHLQNIEIITIDGGRVNGAIDASAAPAGVMFNLNSGMVGSVTGSAQVDRFVIGAGIRVSGTLNGGAGTDALSLSFTPASANLFDNVLTLTLTGGGSLTFTLDSIEDTSAISGLTMVDLDDMTMPPPGLSAMRTFTTGTPTQAERTGGAEDNVFTIAGDITGGSPALNLGVIDGRAGSDRVELNTDAEVASIAFSDTDPTSGTGALHLENIETITIDGGTVNGAIDASAATAGVTFNLMNGMVGSVTGSAQIDSFVIGSGIMVSGTIDGGGDEADTLSLSSDFPALTAANLFDNVLTLTLSGGGIRMFTLANIGVDDVVGIDILTMTPMVMRTFANGQTPTTAQLTGSVGNDVFTITGDITGTDAAMNLILEGPINGGDGSDTVVLNTGAVVTDITFASRAPDPAELTLQNIETLTINGSMIRSISVFGASAGVTFNLLSGAFGSINGSEHNDRFVIGSGIASGSIDGRGGTDILSLAQGFMPTAAHLFRNVLTLILSDNSRLTFSLTSVEDTDEITGLIFTPPSLAFTGTEFNDIVIIENNLTGSPPEQVLDIVLNGGGGTTDTLIVNAGGVVRSISFDTAAPSGGDVHLQNFEAIQMSGGMVTGVIDASMAPLFVTFDLRSGTVGGAITGSGHNDLFILQGGEITGNVLGGNGSDSFRLFSAIRIRGHIDGGVGGFDVLVYTGAGMAPQGEFFFPTRGGLAEDDDIRDSGDDAGSVRNIEIIQEPVNAPINSLSVRNIESLELSPALNLYGALSDALMQFAQQTAQGFALADTNPQTGRLTQLMSKDSPFTKGRIWAHKITHSGNGKGSIGLSLTGLTARAPSDYDYQMNLTQHGFDAPIVSSQWGDFGLRAVSHTMTGTIETNIAEAQVSGYGAGLAWLWSGDHLSANLTTLAGAYEVDAHTSPLNPQAVINEVSEGSFSAINAVISAGIADKRELVNGLVMRTTADVSWQTLSLDDFTETGENGIIVNFDKATRLTARIGAGLESEHWFSDIAFVHETSSGGTLSSGLRQDYRQHDGTAFEMKFGGKIADLASGLTIKAFAVWRQSVSGLAGEPSAQFELSYRF